MADADTGAKPVDQVALVADIDRTRMELARTIDAIADRVSPRARQSGRPAGGRRRRGRRRGRRHRPVPVPPPQALARPPRAGASPPTARRRRLRIAVR
jgi:hypothetical protein